MSPSQPGVQKGICLGNLRQFVSSGDGMAGDLDAALISSALTFSGWWHAARCPLACSASGGSIGLQISVARGQRGWNRQPGGGSIGLGTSPVDDDPLALAAVRSGRGSAPPTAARPVYGWIGFA